MFFSFLPERQDRFSRPRSSFLWHVQLNSYENELQYLKVFREALHRYSNRKFLLRTSKARADMEEEIKHLIHLFQKADVKRRRKLYECFASIFDSQNSYVITIEILNEKLGAQVVSAADVKYIRAHCSKWQKTLIPPQQPSSNPVQKRAIPKITWSDPDQALDPAS